MRSRVTLLICLLVLALPAAAGAQAGNPFMQTPSQQQAPAAPAPAGTDDGGLKSWQQILIFLAGGVVLVGIGYAIVGDARRNAPVEEQTEELAAAKARMEEDRRRQKTRARAAAKRARASRKRNRA